MTTLSNPLQFIENLPPEFSITLQRFAVAESLTDLVAHKIIDLSPIHDISSDVFLELIHCADFVSPRNDDWCLSANAREYLLALAKVEGTNLHEVHSLLLDIGAKADKVRDAETIPAYLFTLAGKAYHKAALGKIEEALGLYAKSAWVSDYGELWLAGMLATEQQNMGILPAEAIEPVFLRGLNFYRDNDINNAFKAFQTVASSKLSRIEVGISLHLIGLIQSRRNQLKKALTSLDASIQTINGLAHPDNVSLTMALNTRATVNRNVGDIDAALSDLNQAEQISSGDNLAKILNTRASVRRDIGDMSGALSDLDRAFEVAQEYTRCTILNVRGSLKRDMDDLPGAIEDLNLAVKGALAGDLASIFNTRAGVWRDLGEFDLAIADLTQALKFSTRRTTAFVLNTRFSAKRDAADFEGALQDLKTIAELPEADRKNTPTGGNRRRQLEKLIRDLQQASSDAARDKTLFTFWTSIADVYARGHEPSRALIILNRAMKLAQDDHQLALCNFKAGQTLERSGKASLAIPYLQEAITLDSSDSRYYATLARAMDDSARPLAETQPLFERALDLDENNYWARSWYSLALARANQMELAEKHARAALIDPKAAANAVIVLNLATVLNQSSDRALKEEALVIAKRAKELALPNFNAPQQFLDKHLGST